MILEHTKKVLQMFSRVRSTEQMSKPACEAALNFSSIYSGSRDAIFEMTYAFDPMQFDGLLKVKYIFLKNEMCCVLSVYCEFMLGCVS